MKRTALKRQPNQLLQKLYPKRKRVPPPGNKYGAVSCVYNGRTFHSRKEAAYAATLDQLKKAVDPRERVLSWRGQVNVALRGLNGTKVCTYIPDFEVSFADGRTEFHEVKGFETPEWRLKHKLFVDNFPDRTLRVIR